MSKLNSAPENDNNEGVNFLGSSLVDKLGNPKNRVMQAFAAEYATKKLGHVPNGSQEDETAWIDFFKRKYQELTS